MTAVLSVAGLAAPPAFGVPALFDAFWGWLLTLVVLALPFVLLAFRTHRVFGHWTRLFAQWRRRSWWLLVTGAVTLSGGVFVQVGALPAWQGRWAAWFAAAQASDPAHRPAFDWLAQMHERLAQLVQVGALALMLAGIAALAVSIRHLVRNVLVRRRAVPATPDWVMLGPPPVAPPDLESPLN